MHEYFLFKSNLFCFPKAKMRFRFFLFILNNFHISYLFIFSLGFYKILILFDFKNNFQYYITNPKDNKWPKNHNNRSMQSNRKPISKIKKTNNKN
jgi:hypothetical protein